MNTKVVGALLIGAAIGVGIGLLIAPQVLHLKGLKTIGRDIQAYITIDTTNNNVCTQHTGSLSGPESPPPNLQAPNASTNGDTITWHGNTNAQKVVIQFPQGSPDDPGTPFEFAGNGQRRTDFANGDDSGPAFISASKDFPFYAVTVGGQTCSNPQGMGVHVSK